jgi:hypothetical protein
LRQVELARRIGNAACPGSGFKSVKGMDGRKKAARYLHAYSNTE